MHLLQVNFPIEKVLLSSFKFYESPKPHLSPIKALAAENSLGKKTYWDCTAWFSWRELYLTNAEEAEEPDCSVKMKLLYARQTKTNCCSPLLCASLVPCRFEAVILNVRTSVLETQDFCGAYLIPYLFLNLLFHYCLPFSLVSLVVWLLEVLLFPVITVCTIWTNSVSDTMFS